MCFGVGWVAEILKSLREKTYKQVQFMQMIFWNVRLDEIIYLFLILLAKALTK